MCEMPATTHAHELVHFLLPRGDEAALAEHVVARSVDAVLVAGLPAGKGDEDVLLQLHGEGAVRLPARRRGSAERQQRVLQ